MTHKRASSTDFLANPTITSLNAVRYAAISRPAISSSDFSVHRCQPSTWLPETTVAHSLLVSSLKGTVQAHMTDRW